MDEVCTIRYMVRRQGVSIREVARRLSVSRPVPPPVPGSISDLSSWGTIALPLLGFAQARRRCVSPPCSTPSNAKSIRYTRQSGVLRMMPKDCGVW
jgi:hypothetical protein